MTPTLVDSVLERQLVAALLHEPELHDSIHELGVADFGDVRARQIYGAIANIRARGERASPAAIASQLLDDWIRANPNRPEWDRAGYARETLAWVEEIAAIPVPDPQIDRLSGMVILLARSREADLAEAETPRRRPPRGPRAVNLEPVRLAEAFRRYSYERDGHATLVRWARAWWRYNGMRYIELDDELLDRDLIAFLDVAVAPQTVTDRKTGAQREELRRVTSRNKTLSEVRKALTFVMPVIAGGAPQWTELREADPPAEHAVVCENGILNLQDLALSPSTPRLFATNAIGCAWDPDSPEPVGWLDFLQSLWPDDSESILALQQLFGYLLTADTSQQKIFALIGPPRSGKGTIARVLRALLGDDAVVNPTLQSLERPFGLAPLVGKTVAIIGDARLGGHTDQQQVVERLLSISGEDALSIDRKNRDPINVRLRCRVLLLSNELPRLYDTSGALASRFVILTLSRSFLGEEDTTLEAKLLAELPGIFRWALEGRADLHERGRFVQPLASEVAVAHLRAISNPLGVFLEECCEMGPGGQCDVGSLYTRYQSWCETNGREPANVQIFARDLHTVHPELKVVQARLPDGRRVRRYEGLRLTA